MKEGCLICCRWYSWESGYSPSIFPAHYADKNIAWKIISGNNQRPTRVALAAVFTLTSGWCIPYRYVFGLGMSQEETVHLFEFELASFEMTSIETWTPVAHAILLYIWPWYESRGNSEPFWIQTSVIRNDFYRNLEQSTALRLLVVSVCKSPTHYYHFSSCSWYTLIKVRLFCPVSSCIIILSCLKVDNSTKEGWRYSFELNTFWMIDVYCIVIMQTFFAESRPFRVWASKSWIIPAKTAEKVVYPGFLILVFFKGLLQTSHSFAVLKGLFIRTLSVWYYQVYDFLPCIGSNVYIAPGCIMPYQSSNSLWQNDTFAYFSRSTWTLQKNAWLKFRMIFGKLKSEICEFSTNKARKYGVLYTSPEKKNNFEFGENKAT